MYLGTNYLRLGHLELSHVRFPSKYGYKWFTKDRFGGGWDFELGFRIGGTTLMLMLGIGMVRIHWMAKDEYNLVREHERNGRGTKIQ